MTDLTPVPQSAGYPARSLTGRVVEHVRLWRERRRWIGEMANAAAFGRLDDVLTDVGLNRAELGYLMDGPVDAGRQFEVFARMEGLDIHRLPTGVLREAVRTCAHCHCRTACKRWLRTGVWKHDGDSRCPNAALLHH